MRRKSRIWIYLLLMGFALSLTYSCKKDKGKDVTLTIGQSYQGGVIFYILRPGDKGYDANVQHGLIAASSDQGRDVGWGCWGREIAGADGTAIGTGNQNTIDIMAGCSQAGIAARLCGDLELGGYSDWYLPSKEELSRLYDNKAVVGGFDISFYWSSSESKTSDGVAWVQDFRDGEQYNGAGITPNVRAIRSF